METGEAESTLSGPAKGYVEALEHRLQVTEGVLVKLLSQVPDAQLATTFPEGKVLDHDVGTGYVPLARLEKKGIEEWSRFPLDTAPNIRTWQQVCMGQGAIESSNRTNEADRSFFNLQLERGVKRKFTGSGHQDRELGVHVPSSRTTATLRESGQSASPPTALEQAPDPSSILTGHGLRTSLSAPGSEPPSSSNAGANEPTGPKDLRSMQPESSWDGGPSLSFQRQFLW